MSIPHIGTVSAPRVPGKPTCFRHHTALWCGCGADSSRAVEQRDIVAQVEHGATECRQCGKRLDLREGLRRFHSLGTPEGLFGLDVYVIGIPIAATESASILQADLTPYLPSQELVFANVTPEAADVKDIPFLLAPQNMHHRWSANMRFHVPAGKARKVNLLVVAKPEDPLDPALEIAVQAVENFHQGRLLMASVLLLASVEESFRSMLQSFYTERGVPLSSDLGFANLLERVRLVFEPRLGPQIVGKVKELASKGRNPGAHGRAAVLPPIEVAGWMVDVAAIYEWSKLAKPLKASAAPG